MVVIVKVLVKGGELETGTKSHDTPGGRGLLFASPVQDNATLSAGPFTRLTMIVI